MSMSGRVLAAKKILVVEDHPDSAAMLAEALQHAGAVALVASDATEALTTLRRERLDAIVADLRMPGMSGFELIKLVRTARVPHLRSIPAVAVSGETDWRFQDPFEASRAGFDFHLTKPVEPSLLVRTIGDVLRWRRRQTPP